MSRWTPERRAAAVLAAALAERRSIRRRQSARNAGVIRRRIGIALRWFLDAASPLAFSPVELSSLADQMVCQSPMLERALLSEPSHPEISAPPDHPEPGPSPEMP